MNEARELESQSTEDKDDSGMPLLLCVCEEADVCSCIIICHDRD